MSVKIERPVRVFEYNGMKLEDPDPGMTAPEVKDYWADVYPELTQAAISGPEYDGPDEKWTFEKRVGTKGVTVRQAARMEPVPADEGEAGDHDLDFRLFDIVFKAALSTQGDPVPAPSKSLGVV